jgi:ribosome biogenesis GTPase
VYCPFSEPGCAILVAIEAGELEPDRLQRHRKLSAEDARNSASLAERQARDKAFGKVVKGVMRDKRRRQDL